ncbi:GAF domain-containing protein [Deinococcus aluminii]|uniref:histidine kinase n=1 Tax=Deinococcus aluminii TaxID=1656885 RepID=A0ABP9XFS7_9DEIO
MSEQPATTAGVRPALGERLQEVTEALAAAQTPEAVFGAALTPALEATGALAGAVLLVGPGGGLERAAVQGQTGEAGWAGGPLEEGTPAGNALRRGEALFFEQPGDLGGAAPGLWTAAAQATALLPMVLDQQPLGVLVLEWPAPHPFTPEERRFLATLSGQCALALGRARLLGQLRRAERRQTDILESIDDAFYALDHQGRFTYVNRRAEQLWGRRREDLLGRVCWEAFPQVTGGEAYRAHLTAATERRVVRLEVPSAILGTWLDICICPSEAGLSVYFKDITGRKQVEAQVRDLNRTLEQCVRERTRESEEARRTAEVLAALGDALQRATSPEEVAALALAPLGEALGARSAMVVGLEQDCIRVPTVWGEVRPSMAAVQARGKPLEDTVLLARAARTGEAGYYADYNAARGGLAGLPPLAFAAEPIRTPDGQLAGFLAVWRDPREVPWPEGDRDLLRRAAGTLGLALERAAAAAQLEARTRQIEEAARAQQAFIAFSEAAGTETDVLALVRQAIEVLRVRFPEGSIGYYEREGDRWKVRVYSDDVREQASARLLVGLSARTPLIAEALSAQQAVFKDAWDPAREALRGTEPYGTAASYPLLVGGEVLGLLLVGLKDTRQWQESDQALIRAVGRGLNLALERAEVTRQLLAQHQSLEATNEELEAFAYSVSHDLRTPVRHVMSFGQLLRKSLGTRLDEKSARYLTVVDQAAVRMDSLIDAMLNLSRTSRLPLRLGPVDLGMLVDTVRAELEADVLERAVNWDIHPLPLVTADHDTLRQVISNLLDNALKYTRTRDPARIEVWAEERPHEWCISVRDNGVGFDPRYQNKLFGVFQRLHRAEDFEGTGVGLANVRRIIARHGGRVAAESQPGQGATFTFTLPRS